MSDRGRYYPLYCAHCKAEQDTNNGTIRHEPECGYHRSNRGRPKPQTIYGVPSELIAWLRSPAPQTV